MDSDEENDLMAVRAKNMAKINNMFGDVFCEAKKIVDEVKSEIETYVPKPAVRKKRKRSDETFQFGGYLPTERRKSERLTNTKPRFSYADLEKIEGLERFDGADENKDPDFYMELEDVIREPRGKTKRIIQRSSSSVIVRMPHEITDYELSRIATRSTHKTYSQTGTSCHQCRQKTIDTKTLCRSGVCIGVRGQFCGPCLKNRYGEDARDALLDPEWTCPPCRNLCNCSICRTREGKRPTGILAPTVQQEGFSSVKDFLLSLAEKGILKKRKPNAVIKRFTGDIYEDEYNDGIYDFLIDGYVKKTMRVEMKHEVSNIENDLLGFLHGKPINDLTEELENAELLGFETTENKTRCLLLSNTIYQCF